jgi:hypothetical protein
MRSRSDMALQFTGASPRADACPLVTAAPDRWNCPRLLRTTPCDTPAARWAASSEASPYTRPPDDTSRIGGGAGSSFAAGDASRICCFVHPAAVARRSNSADSCASMYSSTSANSGASPVRTAYSLASINACSATSSAPYVFRNGCASGSMDAAMLKRICSIRFCASASARARCAASSRSRNDASILSARSNASRASFSSAAIFCSGDGSPPLATRAMAPRTIESSDLPVLAEMRSSSASSSSCAYSASSASRFAAASLSAASRACSSSWRFLSARSC